MRLREIIQKNMNEIEYASNIVPFRTNVDNLEIIGHMENRDIAIIQDNNHEIYIMKTEDDKMMAYVALSKHTINGYYPINQFENVSKTPGAITALIAFLVSNKKYKLTFDKTEPLTYDGLQWLLKLIKNKGRGFTITDNTGHFPLAQDVIDDWNNSRNDNTPGKINVFIENKNHKIQTKNDNLIKQPFQILFDERFL